MTAPARPQDEAHMKPHKGTIRDWVELPCRGGLGYYIAGHSIDHPQFGGGEIYTSWVVKHDRATDEIETNNSRYTLIEPHGRKPPPAPVVEGTPEIERLLSGIGEIYQVVGLLADRAGLFDHPQVIAALDWLADPQKADCDVLPFQPAPSAPDAAVVAEIEKRSAEDVCLTIDGPHFWHRKFGEADRDRATLLCILKSGADYAPGVDEATLRKMCAGLQRDNNYLRERLKSGGARTAGTREICFRCGAIYGIDPPIGQPAACQFKSECPILRSTQAPAQEG